MADTGVTIIGLREFSAAVRLAQGRYPSEVSRALAHAGAPVLARVHAVVPHSSGALAAGYRISVRGTKAQVVSSVLYAGGAEWGRYGKWSGFLRYGSPGRFVWSSVEANKERIQAVIAQELAEIVTILGWAH